ncbi:hypothetical protein [Sphingomonas elodea]|uniref:hypothetical protein n=1 Tax=Sphingomonas elodea TaxID=179878 RepID=UPI0002631DC6|nr:hypothetical protein [Sphingomonas elodea]
MSRPARFTQSDVARALKGAKAAGYTHVRIRIDVAGNIEIMASDCPAASERDRQNPLDRLLRPA